ncbi:MULTISPECIES: DoxX family protein [unclassified Thalassospira]|uniref:DoxX family protein n=1 Tax=unclassified Thalassospira TaxID=2648997 RepID=UPI0025DE36BD|nr:MULTISPECIES: DoxX family protein [unclassified Thalassospira]|tara:strand:+ start:2389 stop:2931 length:543 start_codon:yes stop_codon:yes gene_type:complete
MMMNNVHNVMGGFARFETKIDSLAGRDYVGLGARVLFVVVLLPYYFNSALTKIDGFGLSAGAFAQILPPVAEQYMYDTSAIPFFPWHLIVWAGTIGEFVLPLLIVAGLFTRLAALGMIGFVIVQTVVDVAFHGATLGMLANGLPTELIDQRLLWVSLLAALVFAGGGVVSLDRLARRAVA